MKRVFVSCSTYALGRELGFEQAIAELHRQLEDPDFDSLPCVRNIHRLRKLVDVELHLDTGGTPIGKVRSRAAHAAFQASECDAWVALDDDLEASSQTLVNLLLAVEDLVPRVVTVPYVLRLQEQRAQVSVEFPNVIRVDRRLSSGALLRQCGPGGFGLVGMNRAALVAAVEAHPELRYVDDDGVERTGLFYDCWETVDGKRRWFGEDYSFFIRLPASVSLEALLTGHTSHGGVGLELATLQ